MLRTFSRATLRNLEGVARLVSPIQALQAPPHIQHASVPSSLPFQRLAPALFHVTTPSWSTRKNNKLKRKGTAVSDLPAVSSLPAAAGSKLEAIDYEVPKVAIIGRPNVGKSALFNRLLGKRTALVYNTPDGHVTRDIREGIARLLDLTFQVLDTAGIEPHLNEQHKDHLQARAVNITRTWLMDADIVLFLTDARSGLFPGDFEIARWLRKQPIKNLVLVANKCERARVGAVGPNAAAPDEVTKLGFGSPVAISAETGEGMTDLYAEMQPLIDAAVERIAEEKEKREAEAEEKARAKALKQELEAGADADVDSDTTQWIEAENGTWIKVDHRQQQLGNVDYDTDEDDSSEVTGKVLNEVNIPMHFAVIGLPNVGKSTLINQLIGQDRMLTGPEAGLTRDAIRSSFMYEGKRLWLVDTAGWERRTKLESKGKVAELGNLETRRALYHAHVIALTLCAQKWHEIGKLSKQERALVTRFVKEGKAIIVVLNKLDYLQDLKEAGEISSIKQKIEQIQEEVERTFPQLGRVPVVALSAKTGRGAHKLLPEVVKAYDQWNMRISTGRLNRWLLKVSMQHAGMGGSHGVHRIRYLSQVKARPPTFVAFLRGKNTLDGPQTRSIVKSLRADFGFDGVPVRVLPRLKEMVARAK